MTAFRVDVSMSLDGFIAGPGAGPDEPLGRGGSLLHEWLRRQASWREAAGVAGGEEGADDELHRELVEEVGAVVLGRKMFSGGSGPWEADPKPQGFWGDEPPFHAPVFVLTHHAREPLVLSDTTFTFLDDVDLALARAAEAAQGRAVGVAGAQVIRQCLQRGVVDLMTIHLVPVLLGDGVRLFGEVAARLELVRVVPSPDLTHLIYRLSA
jgi:dihydrofolate reductase